MGKIQFILGNAGSGKSTRLYEWLISEAVEHPLAQYMLLVPEQFTMQTQREIVLRHPTHSVMNIEVLSFNRLAYRIFDELGTDTLSVLEETGKNLVLRKVAEDKMDELDFLRGNIKKRGYISEMKSLISELTQYGISPDDFEDMMENPVMSDTFRLKAKDILTMYRGFLSFIDGKYITTEEILEKLIEVVRDSKLLKNAVLAFDNYTGFTPLQNELLSTIFPMIAKAVFTVTIAENENIHQLKGEQELFFMSKKMIRSLERMAQQTGMEIEEPILLGMDKNVRYFQQGMLMHLEKNIFRKPSVFENRSKTKKEEIELYRLPNPRQELMYAAAKIRGFLRENPEQYHYRDFAVVCPNTEDYQNYVEEVFKNYEIPIFIDTQTEIVFHPFIEFIQSSLLVIANDFSYETVFHFLKTGLLPFSMEEIDRFENYILASGIRGSKNYREPFYIVPPKMEPAILSEMNLLREKFIEPWENLTAVFLDEKSTVKNYVEALYRFILFYAVEEKLEEKADTFLKEKKGVKEKQYRQIYGIVMDLFDKMVTILGNERMDLEEFQNILAAGFEAAKVAVIPPSQDNVVFGDIERTRLEHVKILFLVGANDGSIPMSVSNGGILSQMEREKLKEEDVELAPTEREKSFMQRFYLYLTMTKPSEKLIISYARLTSSGEAARQSYLIGLLKKMFPAVTVKNIEDFGWKERVQTVATEKEYFIEKMRDYAKGQTDGNKALLAALYQWNDENESAFLERMLPAIFYFHTPDEISEAAIKAISGDKIQGSVSRLEQYAKCAYAFFLRYTLALNERPQHELEAMDMGNLYHEALERYALNLEASSEDWFTVSEETQKVLLEGAIRETYEKMEKAEFLDSPREAYILHRMQHTLERTVEVLTKQVRKGKFIPKGFEVDFREIDDLNALKFSLDNGEMMTLNGKIDRLDTYETQDRVYVKIIDYKSGEQDVDLTKLYYGIQLQLVLYMNAACEGEAVRKKDKEIIPAAMLYYHIDDPIIDALMTSQEKDTLDKLYRQKLTGKGLLYNETDVLRALDEETVEGTSEVIPVTWKKDGTIRNSESLLNADEFEVISKWVNKKITEAGNKISRGDIAMNPYKDKTQCECDFCPYHSICKFDPKLPGFSYHKLEQKNALQAMKEEEE